MISAKADFKNTEITICQSAGCAMKKNHSETPTPYQTHTSKQYSEKITDGGDCESKINHQCETYSINKLKFRNNSNDYTHSIVFDDIDCSRILRFCIAILWRASISPAEYFRDFRLDRDIEVTFKKYLAGHLDKIDERLFSFTIEKAYTSGQNESSFDESFLLPPINCSDKNRRTYQFIVGGFLFSLITPRLSLRERSGIKLIKASDTRLVARRTSIFEHKHIMPFLAKHVHEERERRGL